MNQMKCIPMYCELNGFEPSVPMRINVGGRAGMEGQLCGIEDCL